jgi:phosphoribosylaminoimidazole-succinocarboxamide synthase
MPPPVVLDTQFDTLTLSRRGKVRDVYDLGAHQLNVATDRISAFDHVLGSGIPGKGAVLTQLSAFWFDQLGDLVPHHVVAVDVDAFPPETRPYREILRGRSMLVKKTAPLPIECVARGYLAGSGWKEYRASGTICGVPLPPGFVESDRLPAAIFTPATKAESGHDENISETQAGDRIGHDLVRRLRELTLSIYAFGVEHAASCGIIIADTKFEFGLAGDTVVLIDEVLTPDSSRFWPAAEYAPGRSQPSFDKQFVRDYLERIGWDKQPPVPALPEDVVARTSEKYLEAYRRLTGRGLRV